MDDKRDDGAVARERAGHLKHATDLARRLEEVLEQADALKWTGFNTVLPRIEFAADDAARGLGKSHQDRETYPIDRLVTHLFAFSRSIVDRHLQHHGRVAGWR